MSKQPDPQWVQAPDGTWHQRVEPTPKKSSSSGAGCGAVVLILVLIVGAVMLIGALAGGSKSEADKAKGSSSLACDHFRNIAGDVQDGLLTDAEVRSKLQEVNSNAVIATPEVQKAAKGMLAAMTSKDSAQLKLEVGAMDSACTAAGH